jgi:hypothetical protein
MASHITGLQSATFLPKEFPTKYKLYHADRLQLAQQVTAAVGIANKMTRIQQEHSMEQRLGKFTQLLTMWSLEKHDRNLYADSEAIRG